MGDWRGGGGGVLCKIIFQAVISVLTDGAVCPDIAVLKGKPKRRWHQNAEAFRPHAVVLRIYIYLSIYPHTHTYSKQHTHTHTHTYSKQQHTHTHTHTHTYTHTHTHTQTHTYTHTHTEQTTHTHTQSKQHTHTHTHSYTHTHKLVPDVSDTFATHCSLVRDVIDNLLHIAV